MDDILLELADVKKHFPVTRGVFKKVIGHVKAVDGVSFAIKAGETFSLVGESGCGKTTMGNLIVRALPPSSGEILFRHNGNMVDLAGLSEQELKAQGIRRAMQMIFQDPFSSLNPRMRVLDVVGEPLVVNQIARGKELEDRVRQLLGQVGLKPHYLKRYPHAFSGGQRQRIGLARALALNPSLIVADEPVSALDVSIQAQILNLLQDLQEAFQLTYLFISHDLSVVEHISDRVAVMYVGKDCGVGGNRASLPSAQASLHRGAAVSGAAIRSGVEDGADSPSGRGCRPGRSSIGLRVSPALPLSDRTLRQRGTGLAGDGTRSLCQLPSHRGTAVDRGRASPAGLSAFEGGDAYCSTAVRNQNFIEEEL